MKIKIATNSIKLRKWLNNLIELKNITNVADDKLNACDIIVNYPILVNPDESIKWVQIVDIEKK